MSITISAGSQIGVQASSWRQSFIDVVLGVCGSGKTNAYTQHIITSPSARFIVAAKTDKLCEQIHRGLPGSVLINTDTLQIRKQRVQHSVTMAVCNAVKSYQRVIVVTHKALELLSMRLHSDDVLRCALIDYQVIIDEAPDSRKQINTRIDRSVSGVYPWLPYTTIVDGLMYATQVDKLRQVLKGGDSRNAALIIALINGDRVRVADLEDNIQQVKCLARSDLYAIARVAPVVLVGADMVSAPFVKTGVRRGFIDGVQESPRIRIDPDRAKHQNTERVKISCLLDVPASKRAIKKHHVEIADKVIEQLSIEKTGKRFLFTCNRDEAGADGFQFETYFRNRFEPVGGVWIPPKAEGLNTYDEYDAAVWLCSVRFRPEDKAAFEDDEEASDLESWEDKNGCYQFLARTGIRKQGNVEHLSFTFLVLDESQRDYCVSRYFHQAGQIEGHEQIHVEQVDPKARGQAKVNKTLQQIQASIDRLKLSGVKVNQTSVAKDTGLSRMTVSRNWSNIAL